ncbi:MAG: fibronectin type III domain-containing protein [Ignavibacteriales bacterium]|nr:fibronectin type III domain-containing protein [Ignavibacteriales bacterium]
MKKLITLLIFIPLILSAQAGPPTPTPADAAPTISLNLASISWTAFDDGNGVGNYDVELADASFAGSHSTVAFATNTAATTLAIPTLLIPSNTYYWRVRDTNIDGAGADGPWYTFSFTTILLPTSQASAVVISSVTTTSFQVNWTVGNGATEAVFVRTGSTGTAFPINGTTYTPNTLFGSGTQISASGWYCVFNGGPGGPVTVTGLTAGSTYSVMVCDLNGGVGTQAYNINTAAGNPNTQVTMPVVTTTPITADILVGTSVFSGGNVTYGGSTVTVRGVCWNTSGTPTTADPKTTNGAGGGTFTSTVTPLVVGTQYYLRAYATNAAGTAYGNEVTFVAANFNASASISTNFVTGVSILPVFDWDAIGAGTTYTLEVSTSSSFGSLITLTGNAGIVGNSYTVIYPEFLNNGTLYYWRVKATVGAGALNGIYSPAWQFTSVNISKPEINPINPGVTSAFIGWYQVPYSSGLKFDLYRATNVGMTANLTTVTDLTNSYYTYNGLSNGTTYYLQVRAKNSTGAVIISYSDVKSFTTLAPPKPTISYPIGGVTVYASTPTFFWYIEGNEPALDYEIEWQPLATPFTNVPQITTTSNKLYKTLTTALTAGGSYHWQVRSKAGANVSSWSDPATFVEFSSLATVPPVPFPSWPAGSPTPTIYNNPPVLYFYIDVYATGLEFQAQYSPANTLLGGAGTSFNNSPVDLPWTTDLFSAVEISLIPGNTYYWHVRSRLAANPGVVSLYSDPASFKIATTASGAATTPIPSAPVGGIILDSPLSGITLAWTAPATEPLQYQVRIAQSSSVDGSGMLDHPLAVSTTAGGGYPVSDPTNSILITDIPYSVTPGATYYWQVRSRLVSNPLIFSAWSMVATFSTAAGSSSVVPLVISPNYGQPINNTSAILTWKIPVPTESHLKYDLQYSKNSNFNNIQTITNLNESVAQVSGLESNTRYYWRVLSKTDNGSVSSYSTTGSFITSGTTAVENQEVIPTQFELSQNYPNPFNPTTRINFAIPQNSFVSIKVYDMLGQEVKTLINQEMVSGNHSIDWNADNNLGIKVATGMYIYRITAGNFVSTKKMVLIK